MRALINRQLEVALSALLPGSRGLGNILLVLGLSILGGVYYQKQVFNRTADMGAALLALAGIGLLPTFYWQLVAKSGLRLC